MRSENKPKINVTVSNELLSWIDKEVDKRRFASRSHAVEATLHWYRQYIDTGELPPR